MQWFSCERRRQESAEAEVAVVHDSDIPLWEKMNADADDDKIGIIFNPVTKSRLP
jgi:hypothetical protein